MALPSVTVDARGLSADVIDRRVPSSAIWRRYYGRGVDLAAIEAAVRSAEIGLMADLCDLETETMAVDPHLSGVLAKRFGSLEMLPRRFEPSEGDDVDKDLAAKYCNIVKRVFDRIPCLGERVYDLSWALYDGRSAGELKWERCAGGELRMVPLELRWIHPRNLNFGPERELRYIDSWRARGYFAEDGIALRDYPGKFVSWTPRLFREYPEREGLAPRCLYWSFFKRFSWRMRMLLTELFGVPWRIVKTRDSKDAAFMANGDELTTAHKNVQALGAETTATIGPGVDVDVIQGDGKNAELFEMTSEQVDAQISKLVLGQVGTTDGASAGLNSNTVGVMKQEQDTIKERDASGMSGRLREDLASWILRVNFGDEVAALYTPRVVLDASPNRDRKTEMELAERAVKLSVPVALKQVREIAGVREPEEGEEVVEPPPPPPAFGAPPGEPESEDHKRPPPPAKNGEDAEDDEDEGTRMARVTWRDTIRALAREERSR